VFISYATNDQTIAEEVCRVLESDGIGCWIAPRDVSPGHDYAEQILDGIESARVMVLLLSGHANTSTFVRNEVERAISKGKVVIPLRIQDVQPSRSLELFVSRTQWIDAWTPPLDSRIHVLAVAIRGLLSLPTLQLEGPITARGVEAAGSRSHVSAATTRARWKLPVLIGVGLTVALVAVVAAGAFVLAPHPGSSARSMPAGGSTAMPSPAKDPQDGAWSGGSYSGTFLNVSFSVSGGAQLLDLKATFLAPSGAAYSWSCGRVALVSTSFGTGTCLDNYGWPIDLSGTFSSATAMSGDFAITTAEGDFVGSWSATPD
jgi:hypothetical protein